MKRELEESNQLTHELRKDNRRLQQECGTLRIDVQAHYEEARRMDNVAKHHRSKLVPFSFIRSVQTVFDLTLFL